MALAVPVTAAAATTMRPLAAGEVMCFRYENFDLAYEPCHLYVAATGGTVYRVLWQQRDFISIWHGECTISTLGMMTLKFNHKEEGNTLNNLKTAVCFRTSSNPDTFQGRDYAGRHLELTLLWRKTYDFGTRTYS